MITIYIYIYIYIYIVNGVKVYIVIVNGGWIRLWKFAGQYRNNHPDYRMHWCELVDEPKKQRNIIFLQEDLVLIKTKDLRAEKSRTFKTTLRSSVNYVFNAKVQQY